MTTAERFVDPHKEEINTEEQNDNTNNGTEELENQVEIPEKFQNKSLEDVIHSYTELEKAYGRQANDYGELRKLTDSILLKQLETENNEDDQSQYETVDFDDFVQDPAGSVDKLVSKKLKSVEDKLSEMDKVSRLNDFEKKHPDWRDQAAKDSFQEWVQKSNYRRNLFQRADQYDTEAADELFTTWKELQDITAAQTQQVEQEKEKAREQDLKKVSTESGSTGQSPGKTFKRADIIRMRYENPAKFESMQAEIREAYLQGRVK